MKLYFLFALSVVCLVCSFGNEDNESAFFEEDLKKNDIQMISKPKMKTIVKTFGNGFEKTETTEYDIDNHQKHHSEEIVFTNNYNQLHFENMIQSLNQDYNNPIPISLSQANENNENTSLPFEEIKSNPFPPFGLDIPVSIPILPPMHSSGIVIMKRSNLKGMRNPFNQQRALSPFGLFMNEMLSDIVAMGKQNRQNIAPVSTDQANSTDIILQQEFETGKKTEPEINPQLLSNSNSSEKQNNNTIINNISQLENTLTHTAYNASTYFDIKNTNINSKQILFFVLLIIVFSLLIKYLIKRPFLTQGFKSFSINSSEEDEIKASKFEKVK